MGNIFEYDNIDIRNTLEYENFINMDKNGPKNNEIILYWFLGSWHKSNCELYYRYGHLGFGLPNSNIYGFRCNSQNDPDIFSGKYIGEIKIDNKIFENVKNNKNYKVNEIKVYVNDIVYNQIKSWDNGLIDYSKINSIIFGIHWNNDFQLGIKKSYLPKNPISNCVSFLKFLKPVLKKNNEIYDISNFEILSSFDRYINEFRIKL